MDHASRGPTGFPEEQPHLKSATASPTTSASPRGDAAVWGEMSFVGPNGRAIATAIDMGPATLAPTISSPSSVVHDIMNGVNHFASEAGAMALMDDTKRRLPQELRPVGHCSTPWDRRVPFNPDVQDSVNFLGLVRLTPHVMLRLEFALRLTFLGILPCTLLALEPGANTAYKEASMIMVNCIVVMQPRLGLAIEHAVRIWAALLVFLPISVISIAINTVRSSWAWYFWYCFMVLLIATFTKGLVTKMALFFYSIIMVTHLLNKLTVNGDNQSLQFPLYFMVPCVIGTGIAVIVPLFPYPRTYRSVAESRLKSIFSSINICFAGACHSVWTPSPLERRVNRARIRTTRRAMQASVAEAKEAIEMMLSEPWPPSIQARAEQRFELAVQLLSSVDGVLSYIDSLADDSRSIDGSERAQRWGVAFLGPMLSGCQFMEEFTANLHQLSTAVTEEQLRKLEVCQRLIEDGYNNARNYAMADGQSVTTDGTVDFPFISLGFFLFNLGAYLGTLRHYNIERDSGAEVEHPAKRAAMWAVRGVLGAITDARDLVLLRSGMALRFREALKVAFAMTTAMALLVYLQAPDPASGAAVIGFVKDADPALTVVASVEFVMGTVMGSILGYLTASVSQNLLDVHIWMCALAFTTGFMRSGSRYGGLGFLTQFFGLTTLLAVEVSSTSTLVKIQQNVAAMLWLSITHLVLFPIWPSHQLGKEVHNALTSMRSVLLELCRAIEKDDCNHETLKANREALLASAERLRVLLPHAVAEPDVKRLPFPEHTARALLHSIEVIDGLIGPTVAAVVHEITHHAKPSSTEPMGDSAIPASGPNVVDTDTLPGLVFAQLQESMGLMSLVVDELMRAITAAEQEDHDENTPTLVLLHARVEEASRELTRKAHDVFFARAQKARPAPFRMPALHVTVHFFNVLPASLNQLLAVVVEYRKARSLRG